MEFIVRLIAFVGMFMFFAISASGGPILDTDNYTLNQLPNTTGGIPDTPVVPFAHREHVEREVQHYYEIGATGMEPSIALFKFTQCGQRAWTKGTVDRRHLCRPTDRYI